MEALDPHVNIVGVSRSSWDVSIDWGAINRRFAATDRRFEQLIGYSINRKRDSLDI
jgi:hypothetical protein